MKLAKDIDVEELKKSFTIIDGKLWRIYKTRISEVKVNPVVNHSYLVVGWNGSAWKYHRLLKVLSLGYDIPAGYTVDHMDEDKFNNDLANLQILLDRDNQSKDIVFKDRPSTNQMNFLLNHNGKRISLNMGTYKTLAERKAVWEYMVQFALYRQGLEQPVRDEMWKLIEGGDIEAGKALFKKELDAYLNK